MLSQLDITGFRAFKRLRLPNLACVNLLVGQNNSGKTSALEAVELLLGSLPEALYRNLIRRDQRLLTEDERRWRDPELGADARQIFFGRSLSVGTEALVGGDGRSIGFSVVPAPPPSRQEGEGAPEAGTLLREGPDFSQSGLGIAVRSDNGETRLFDLDKFGRIPAWTRAWRRGERLSSGAPVLFLGTTGADVDVLTGLWGLTVGNPEEELVLDALQIVEPDIERVVHAVTTGKQFKFFLKLKGQPERVPLSTFGEGTSRLLTLGVYLSQARGGALLVDEIDTGLHFTTMERMWRLVLGAAAKLRVQVFATTHSYDCLAALAAVVGDSPAHQDYAVFRIERDVDEATRFDASELAIALQHRMELRG